MAFTCSCPLSWLPIWLQSEVVYPGFIVSYLCKNSFLLPWNSCKQHWIIDALLFLIDVSKSATNFENSFLIDKCSYEMVNTLPSDIFNSSAISCNFNLWSTKTSLWSFWYFPGQLPNLGDQSIQHHLCLYNRVSITPLNHCFQESRVRITLMKPLLCSNSIFSYQKAMLYQHTKFRFFHCFENLQQSSSLSCWTASAHLPDPLPPPFSIVHHSQEVFQATSCVSTELLYIGSSWSS